MAINEKDNVSPIDEYIKNYSDEVQVKLFEIKKIVKRIAPDSTEAISYGIPTFRLHGKNFFHFAAFKSHISVYPFPSDNEKFQQKAKGYKTSKGTIQFPNENPIPYDLVKEIIEYRAKENLNKYSKSK